MRHTWNHNLGLELACRTAEAACAEYMKRFARFHPQLTWHDRSHAEVVFQARGLKMVGRFEVLADGLVLDLDVPLLLRPLQHRGIAVIDREFRRWIERAAAGDLGGAAQENK
ncbi:MAG: polyhydroxyalkanoic acid system family protein [Deltaproteobacteria bacterium]|nr:polyhydroxyalkanoic acid system family protein [Deltaproteobacteria bacterium]